MTLFEADVLQNATTFLLKENAKQHRDTLESLIRGRGAPILAAPIQAGNDRNLSQ